MNEDPGNQIIQRVRREGRQNRKMVALYILLFFAILFVFVMLLKVEIVLEYKTDFSMYIKLLLFKIPIVPAKKKVYTCMTPEKIRRAEEKERKKAAAKEEKKRKKQLKKEDLLKNKTDTETEKATSFSETLDIIFFIIDIVNELIRRLFGRIKTRVYSLKILVGTGDAATTALAFTASQNAVTFLLEFLDKHSGLTTDTSDCIRVYQYYTDKKYEFDIKLGISITVFSALAVILPPGKRALTYYIKKKLS